MRTVCGSKGDQSPLTSAIRSSPSVKAPLPGAFLQLFLFVLYVCAGCMFTIFVYGAEQPPQGLSIIRISGRSGRRRRALHRRAPMITLRRGTVSVVLRRRRPIAMQVMSRSLVVARIVSTAVVPRVVVCAWRRPAVVAPASTSTSASTVRAVAGAQTVGCRRCGLVVVVARARSRVLGQRCCSLANGQCLALGVGQWR